MLRLMSLTLSVIATIAGLGVAPAVAAPEGIVVFMGNDAIVSGFTKFELAAGRPLNTHTWFRDDLRERCIILPGNRESFSIEERAALFEYVHGGGTLIALAEHSQYWQSIRTMNEVAQAVGSNLSIVPATIDPITVTTTYDIAADPLTDGVASLAYVATSEVAVSGGGRVLARTATGSVPFIAAHDLGMGTLVLAGDTNPFTDATGWGSGSGNSGLIYNLCGPEATKVVPNEGAATLAGAISDGGLSARLTTARGRPVANKTLQFTAPSGAVCSAVTDTNGVASCGSAAQIVTVALDGGTYWVSFAGDTWYEASQAAGAVVEPGP